MLQWRVVLIYEDSHLLSSFAVSALNYVLESYGKRAILAHNNSVLRFKSIENIIQIASYTFRYCASLTHIQSDDRTLHPFCLHLHNLQALEEFLLAHEVGFERIDQHRFTKAAWAAQVIILFPPVGKLPDNICLVNIQASLLSDFLERLTGNFLSFISTIIPNLCFPIANLRLYFQTRKRFL